MAWLLVAFAAHPRASDLALPAGVEASATASVRRPLTLAFAAGAVAYLVASLARWPRSGLAIASGLVGLAALVVLAAAGGTDNAAAVRLAAGPGGARARRGERQHAARTLVPRHAEAVAGPAAADDVAARRLPRPPGRRLRRRRERRARGARGRARAPHLAAARRSASSSRSWPPASRSPPPRRRRCRPRPACCTSALRSSWPARSPAPASPTSPACRSRPMRITARTFASLRELSVDRCELDARFRGDRRGRLVGVAGAISRARAAAAVRASGAQRRLRRLGASRSPMATSSPSCRR